MTNFWTTKSDVEGATTRKSLLSKIKFQQLQRLHASRADRHPTTAKPCRERHHFFITFSRCRLYQSSTTLRRPQWCGFRNDRALHFIINNNGTLVHLGVGLGSTQLPHSWNQRAYWIHHANIAFIMTIFSLASYRYQATIRVRRQCTTAAPIVYASSRTTT